MIKWKLYKEVWNIGDEVAPGATNLIREGTLADLGDSVELDTSDGGLLVMELPGGVFLKVRVSEWGTVAMMDKPVGWK